MNARTPKWPAAHSNKNDAATREGAWLAWCAPILAKIEKLRTFLEANPIANEGDWDRPGVYISCAPGTKTHISVRLTEHAPLSIGVEWNRGTYLYRHIPRFDGQGRRCGASEARIYLDKPWSAQEGTVHASWPASWSDVPEVLDALSVSLRMGTPLGSTKLWEQTLHEHLRDQHKNEINVREWKVWAHRWGTPEMEAAIDVVNSLFDPHADVLLWREQVLASWQSPQEPALHELPGNLFGNSSQEV